MTKFITGVSAFAAIAGLIVYMAGKEMTMVVWACVILGIPFAMFTTGLIFVILGCVLLGLFVGLNHLEEIIFTDEE